MIRYPDKKEVAVACGMTEEHLTTLVQMKRLCGKTNPQIEREIMQTAALLGNKVLFEHPKVLN